MKGRRAVARLLGSIGVAAGVAVQRRQAKRFSGSRSGGSAVAGKVVQR